MKKIIISVLLLPILATAAIINVMDNSINAGGQVHWTADNTYLLMQHVWVESGATLTIDPGTVIKSVTASGSAAGALIICRGARIIADGRVDAPIIFTSILDNLEAEGGALSSESWGKWGGIIILGDAKISGGGEAKFEALPATDPRNTFGGTNDNDNSGILRYVSIRYGGTQLAAESEINGLTMCGVGRGTTIDYVEVYNNKDDAFEWFGGCVNSKHLAAIGCGDDCFDTDLGFTGLGQYWLCIHNNAPKSGSASCGEHSNGLTGEGLDPYTMHTAANVTYIAREHAISSLIYKEIGAGRYYNSIFSKSGHIKFLDASGERFEKGEIALNNSVLWSPDSDPQSLRTRPVDFCNDATGLAGSCILVTEGDNLLKNPQISYGQEKVGGGELRPMNVELVYATEPDGAKAVYPVTELDADFFEAVPFKGAFDPCDHDNVPGNENWLKGWTAYDLRGFITEMDAATRLGLCEGVKTAPLPAAGPQAGRPAFRARYLSNPSRLVLHNCRAGDHLALFLADGRCLLRRTLSPANVREGIHLPHAATGAFVARLSSHGFSTRIAAVVIR